MSKFVRLYSTNMPPEVGECTRNIRGNYFRIAYVVLRMLKVIPSYPIGIVHRLSLVSRRWMLDTIFLWIFGLGFIRMVAGEFFSLNMRKGEGGRNFLLCWGEKGDFGKF